MLLWRMYLNVEILLYCFQMVKNLKTLNVKLQQSVKSENYDYSTDILKGQYISNHVALEIFRFSNKDVKFSDECEVLSFLSGKERRSNDLQNKTLYSRLTHLKKKQREKLDQRKERI